LAKELNPFSISPIMFCHIATGSLLLSAIGALQRDIEGFGAHLFFGHTTLLRQGGQRHGRRFVSLPAAPEPSATRQTVS
jgi:hypothetical protein